MRICIENLKLQELIHLITAYKATHYFLLQKSVFEKLKSDATKCNELELNFTTAYGDVSIETVVEFKKFCDSYYKIERVTMNKRRILCYSNWVDDKEQFVIEAE